MRPWRMVARRVATRRMMRKEEIGMVGIEGPWEGSTFKHSWTGVPLRGLTQGGTKI